MTRPQWKTRTATRTPNAASTRMAAAAIEASRSPPWNSRVDDERQGLRPALDVAREHDRRPELAERACPGHHQAGRQRSAGERDGDRPEELPLGGPIDAGGVLEVAVDRRRCRSVAERMKNGAETKVIARMTAIVVNGTEMPRNSNGADEEPRRPNTSSRARPATDGGRTIGRSTTASTSPCHGRRAGPGRRPAAARGRR